MGRKPTPAIERFWPKVDKTDGCWLWTGYKIKGHGLISVDGKMIPAHQFSWTLHGNPIPETGWWSSTNLGGWVLDHDDPISGCSNRGCVNPDHLVAVPHAMNSQRRQANSTSGYVGVYRHLDRFQAEAWRNGKRYYFGVFDTAEEASMAREAALKELKGQ